MLVRTAAWSRSAMAILTRLFGWKGGRTRVPSKEEQFRTIAALAFDCLNMQRIFIHNDEYFIEDRNGNINGKALGYVFGFLDAFLQTKRLDIRDPEGQATLLHLLARLFPAEAARAGTFLMHLRGMSDDAE